MSKKPRREQSPPAQSGGKTSRASASTAGRIHESAKKTTRASANETIADRIRELCESLGGTAELARRLGVSAQMVANWTSGRNIPGGERLAQIVASTGCSGTWLLIGEGTAYQEPDAKQLAAHASLDQAREEVAAALEAIIRATESLAPMLTQSQRRYYATLIERLHKELKKATK